MHRLTVLMLAGFVSLALASPALRAQSFQGLGNLLGEGYSSFAYGVSADGSVVVGSSSSVWHGEAFRWTSGGGMVGLGGGGGYSTYASGVSADGSVVVGGNDNPDSRAFRWTSGGGMVGAPGPFFQYSSATGVSADGSVVVGGVDSESGYEAFRWTSGGGMVGLGDLPGGIFGSSASSVSADGSVVVGGGDSGDPEAFRWTSGGGMVGLGGFVSRAHDVSADGSVVVGRYLYYSYEAFVWTAGTGMVNLQQLLSSNGASNLTGWYLLSEATAISADVRTIVGYGYNPDGNREAWIATIAVPEPSTLLLALCGAAALAFCGWRNRGGAQPAAPALFTRQ